MKRLLTIGCLLILLPGLISAEEENSARRLFSMTIKGGWGKARVGDINAYFKARCADQIFNIPENAGNKIPQLNSNYADVEIEGRYDLGQHLSLGLAVGIPIIKSDQAVWYFGSGSEIQSIEMKARATVYLPVRLNLYYKLQVSPKIELFVGGGPGIYPARMTYSYLGRVDVNSHLPLGLHAGGGVKINLNNRISLVIDGEYRLAKITNFKGQKVIGNIVYKGTLWYFKVRYLGSDIWWDDLEIAEEAPQEDPFGEQFYKDQRRAILDLSGFSIRAGLSFRI